MSSLAVGIDLGTTFSCVAAMVNGKVEVIANDFGHRTTPSVVAFVDGEDKELVGEAAMSEAQRNPANAVTEAKRLIGRDWNDKSVQSDITQWLLKVVNKDGKAGFLVQHKGVRRTLTPQEILAMILRKMKTTAEDFLGQPVSEAVITHPAYFTESQIRATKEAGSLAGLRVLRMMPEPSAAALAYGVDRMDGKLERKVLVYDLGGGTFDVSLVNIKGSRAEVLGVRGNSHLGGLDFDDRIVKHVVQETHKKTEKDLTETFKSRMKLRLLCSNAKHELSAVMKYEIDLQPLVLKEFSVILTREKLEELCKKPLAETIDTVKRVLDGAKLKPSDVDEVVLVGGSTRMPCVRRLLQDVFPGKDIKRTINPDEAVAHGAALYAALLSGCKADILKDMLVLNVTPLSIGVRANGGEYCVVIPRNSTIPVRKESSFTTAFDNQTETEFKVYQGERLVADRNKFLGLYELDNLPRKPNGLRMDFALALDEDGLLVVEAKLESSKEWLGCKLLVNDRGAMEVIAHVEDAENCKEKDALEVKRLRARLDLSKYLKNETQKVQNSKKKILLANAKIWLDSHMNASAEEFESTLRNVKLAVNGI